MTQNRTMFKLGLTLGSFLITFTSTWIGLIVYFVLGPKGFWESLAIVTFGLVFAGGLQFALFLIWLVLVVSIKSE